MEAAQHGSMAGFDGRLAFAAGRGAVISLPRSSACRLLHALPLRPAGAELLVAPASGADALLLGAPDDDAADCGNEWASGAAMVTAAGDGTAGGVLQAIDPALAAVERAAAQRALLVSECAEPTHFTECCHCIMSIQQPAAASVHPRRLLSRPTTNARRPQAPTPPSAAWAPRWRRRATAT
jgi:hypothetical protein